MPIIDPPIPLKPCPFCKCPEVELVTRPAGKGRIRAWARCCGVMCAAVGPVGFSLKGHDAAHTARAACRAWNLAERTAT